MVSHCFRQLWLFGGNPLLYVGLLQFAFDRTDSNLWDNQVGYILQRHFAMFSGLANKTPSLLIANNRWSPWLFARVCAIILPSVEVVFCIPLYTTNYTADVAVPGFGNPKSNYSANFNFTEVLTAWCLGHFD